MKNKRVLGIIPARGGSKGIPRKNIKELKGKALIGYTIESALKSNLITKLIVSTDDEEIKVVAESFGAEVPYLRPKKLATDSALTIDSVKHAIEFLSENSEEFDIVVLLQPTTPLKSNEDIDGAISKLTTTGADTIISMVDVGANHPARMYSISDDQFIPIMSEGVAMKPRQELEPVYIRNGAIYACTMQTIKYTNSFIGKDCRPYIMPAERSVNIDEPLDFVIAEHYLE